MAYLIDAGVVAEVFEHLDFREKNGYERHRLTLNFDDHSQAEGLVYIGTADNFAYAGPADLKVIAEQIRVSAGPSGSNVDYLLELANALRQIDADDPHVFELEALVIQAVSQ